MRALHFGEFGGAVSKTVYSATGLMPLGLFVTGLWLWAKKKRERHLRKGARLPTKAPAAPEAPVLVTAGTDPRPEG